MQRRAAAIRAWDLVLAQRGAAAAGDGVFAQGSCAPEAAHLHLAVQQQHHHQHLGGALSNQQLRFCSPHPPGMGLAARARNLRSPHLSPALTPCQQQELQPQSSEGAPPACPACLSSCHEAAVEQARKLRALTTCAHSPSPTSAQGLPPRLGGPQHPHQHPQPPASAASLYTASWNATMDDDDSPTPLTRSPHHLHDPRPLPQQQPSLLTLLNTPVVLDVATLAPRTSTSPAVPTEAPATSAHKEAAALASHVRWGLPAVAAVSALAAAELLLLPTLAPGGACFGTLTAESLFNLIRQPHDLGGLLEASQGLEWVQGFSLARKLGQVALLDMAIRYVTDGKPRQVFGMRLDNAMDRQRGWAVWACHALVGLAVINLMQQGLDMALVAGSAGAGADTAATLMAGGDERTLPFRCRWWVETCVAAPLLEETLFRGFLITSFAKYMPAWGAVVNSSLLFGLCHMSSASWASLPALTGMGCVLGYTFLRTRNLMAPLAAHSMSNTAALLAADAAAGPL